MLLMNSTHAPKPALNFDLIFLTCQKDVSTLSYDSGDIKNIENELITTKIYTFETRRNIYSFVTSNSTYILSITTSVLQDIILIADSLSNQDPYEHKLNKTTY